jgi:THO complex subunit 2
LEAHAGGETLRTEGGNFLSNITGGSGRAGRRSIAKLRDTLIADGHGRSLLMMLARMRASCIFLYDEENAPIEGNQWLPAVVSTFDKTHEMLQLLVRFLRENTRIVIDGTMVDDNSLATCIQIPNLKTMSEEYGIDLETCYTILRATIKQPRIINLEIDDTNIEELENITQPIKDIERLKKCQSLLDQVVLPPMRDNTLDTGSIPRNLYNLFYSLELYDIFVPLTAYQTTYDRIKAANEKEVKRKEQVANETLLKKLNEEKDKQIKNNEAIITLIKRVRHVLLIAPGETEPHADENTLWSFIEQCIYPRVLYSSVDALYCARFIELLHVCSVPYFNTLTLYYRILMSVSTWVISCTEIEAVRVGRFLQPILATLVSWMKNEKDYKQYGYKIGFQKFKHDINSEIIDYAFFSTNIAAKLTECLTQGFGKLFDKGDPMCVRNALIVLNRIGENNLFPVFRKHAAMLEKRVKTFAESPLENVKVLAVRYHAQLTSIIQKLPPDPVAVTGEEKKKSKSNLNPNTPAYVPKKSRSTTPSENTQGKHREDKTSKRESTPKRDDKQGDETCIRIRNEKRKEDKSPTRNREENQSPVSLTAPKMREEERSEEPKEISRKDERKDDRKEDLRETSKRDEKRRDEREIKREEKETGSSATPVAPGSRRSHPREERQEPPPPPPEPPKQKTPPPPPSTTDLLNERLKGKLQQINKPIHDSNTPPPPPPPPEQHSRDKKISDDRADRRISPRRGRDSRRDSDRRSHTESVLTKEDNRKDERRDRGTKREREEKISQVEDEKDFKRRRDRKENIVEVKEEKKEEKRERRRINRPEIRDDRT